MAHLSSSCLEIIGVPPARCCAILELPLGSGWLRWGYFGYSAGSCASAPRVATYSSSSRMGPLNYWIALSVTAGICEETIFRGYLQRQFMALTKNAPAGIVISAAGFGAAHAYQGFRMAVLISLFGAMFGILAYWRGTVRPGMIVHAWQDSLGGLVGSLMRH